MQEELEKINNNDCQTVYVKKYAKNLIPGDILLHPIYRLDGLLLVDKYKVLTEALIEIIKNHMTLSNLPMFVAPSLEHLKVFLQSKVYKSPQFIDDIKIMANQYSNLTPMQISFNSYLQEGKVVRNHVGHEQFEHNNDFLKLFQAHHYGII